MRDLASIMTTEEWVIKIEEQRLKDYLLWKKEEAENDAYYDYCMSQYKTYSEEEMRDYGHTWGMGIDDSEREYETSLPDRYRVTGKQLELLRRMLREQYITEDDIMYLFAYENMYHDYVVMEFQDRGSFLDLVRELFIRDRKKEFRQIPNGLDEELPFN